MSGGEWLIRQQQPNGYGGFFTERITIEAGTDSGSRPIVDEPNVVPDDYGLHFLYADGRDLIFPWAHIVRAEYRPHPEP